MKYTSEHRAGRLGEGLWHFYLDDEGNVQVSRMGVVIVSIVRGVQDNCRHISIARGESSSGIVMVSSGKYPRPTL